MGRIIVGCLVLMLGVNGAVAGTLTNPVNIQIQEPNLDIPDQPLQTKGRLLILAIQAATAAKGG